MWAPSSFSLSLHGRSRFTSSLLMAPLRRFEWLLFFASFIAFAWFHQGGGWNQNARFAEVRAMAEEGRFAIDSFLIYRESRANSSDLIRTPVENGDFTRGEKRLRLAWTDGEWNYYPINGEE